MNPKTTSIDQIQEGNKLIGKFDNYEQVPEGIKEEYWRYNDSWEWLMPIVEKIESLGYDTGICGVTIKGEKLNEVLISPIDKDNTIEVHSRTDASKIQLTWECVVQFIQWYKNNTTFS